MIVRKALGCCIPTCSSSHKASKSREQNPKKDQPTTVQPQILSFLTTEKENVYFCDDSKKQRWLPSCCYSLSDQTHGALTWKALLYKYISQKWGQQKSVCRNFKLGKTYCVNVNYFKTQPTFLFLVKLLPITEIWIQER